MERLSKELLDIWGGKISSRGINVHIRYNDIIRKGTMTRTACFLFGIEGGGLAWVEPQYKDPYGPGSLEFRAVEGEVKIGKNGDLLIIEAEDRKYYFCEAFTDEGIEVLAKWREMIDDLEAEREDRLDFYSNTGMTFY